MAEPWPSYSSSSRGKKKRPRSPDDDATSSQGRTENSTSLEDNLIFSDTLIALQLMRTQFPKLEKVTKKHLAGRIDRVDANLDETQGIIEETRDEVAVIHVDLSAFQKELQEVSRTVEIWVGALYLGVQGGTRTRPASNSKGSRLSGIEDIQDRTVRATEALVGFSQHLEHGGQNPNIRQVSSFLPALGSSSEQKIKMLPPSPLLSLQTAASVAEPSEDESQENHKVFPSSEGSMRWKLPGLGLSFLRSSSDV